MALLFPEYEDILRFRVKPEIGELYLLEFLKNSLDDTFEVYFNPFLNGDRPDFIIMKENQAVLIIEVKDYNLDSYCLDERKNWKVRNSNQTIKSPISQVLHYKENLFNLHIDKLLAKKINNIKNFNIVSCALYFHNAKQSELNDFLIKRFEHDLNYTKFLKYNINLLGRDDLNEYDFNKLLNKVYLTSKLPSIFFTNDIYQSFRRFLNPPYHFKEQVKNHLKYTEKQLEIIYAGKDKKEQRIKGVVGSGKTTILAARAVQAHKRNNDLVLILTYNITLKNYIKDKISNVRENFSWKNFVILNYHLFINSELNNIGIDVTVPEGFNEYPLDEKEKYFEKTYYSNLTLFEENKDKLKKYNSIFIDEIQDYKRPWMEIIKKYFLEENGEYVLFGDVKQNIYNNKTENKDISTNVWGVNELKYSFRSDYKIKDLTIEFQNDFFRDKYDIDNKSEFTSLVELPFDNQQKGLINYIYLSDTNNVSNLYNIIHQNAINKGIQPNDITILANSISLLKKFDAYYRYSSNEKTNSMFETNEMIYKLGLNFVSNNKLKWIEDFKILIGRNKDYDFTKAYTQISILLTLYDLHLEYDNLFLDKIIQKCVSYNTTFEKFKNLINLNSNEIENFKKSFNSKTLSKNLKFIRDNKKINFYMNSGTVKISTIHSFKGWESDTLFLIIENNSANQTNFDEILYTGITRCRSNLIIINFGNEKNHNKVKKIIEKVK